VRVWDLVTRSCVAKLDGHFSAVTSLALAPDGWTLLSGGRDKVVCLWDLRTNARAGTVPVYEALEGLAALPVGGAFPGVAAAAAAPAGRAPLHFATAGERGQVRLWRADTATCVYTQRRGGGAGAAPGKKPKKAAAAAGSAGGGATNADDEGPPPAGAELTDLQLLPGGRGLLAATGDARLLFFAADAAAAAALASGAGAGTGVLAHATAAAGKARAAAGMVLFRQLVGNQDEVTDLAFLGPPSGPERLAVATNAAEVRLYDLASGMSCGASCVGHRWGRARERARGRLAGLPRRFCPAAGPGEASMRACVGRLQPSPTLHPSARRRRRRASGTSCCASTRCATARAATCSCLAPRTARRARGAAPRARALASPRATSVLSPRSRCRGRPRAGSWSPRAPTS
jgi:hypothetical protein